MRGERERKRRSVKPGDVEIYVKVGFTSKGTTRAFGSVEGG
jgi:hypothetical protein